MANPFENVLIFGERNVGVFRTKLVLERNEREIIERLHVSAHGLDPQARFSAIDTLVPPTVAEYKARFAGMAAKYAYQQCGFGSNIYYTQLMLEGRVDFHLCDCISGPHDIIPALVLMPLAGGSVFNRDGAFPDPEERRLVLCTNGEYDRELLEAVQECYPPEFKGFK